MRISNRNLIAVVLSLFTAAVVLADKLKPNDFVYRGGDCSAESFTKGSNEGNNAQGPLSGISVYGVTGSPNSVDYVKGRNSDFVQKSGCFTRVKNITQAGGTVKAKPVKTTGPDHQEISGLTADQLVAVFGNGSQRWED